MKNCDLPEDRLFERQCLYVEKVSNTVQCMSYIVDCVCQSAMLPDLLVLKPSLVN